MVKGVGLLPEDMDKHLSGLNYPANKQAILKYAKSNPALSRVLTRLNNITDKEYNSSGDILNEIGRFE